MCFFGNAPFSINRAPETEAAAPIPLPPLYGQTDIVQRRKTKEHIGNLPGTGNAGGHPLMHAQSRDVLAGEKNLPGIGSLHAGNLMNQCCLAGAVRPDQCMHLAGNDIQRYITQRMNPAKAA